MSSPYRQAKTTWEALPELGYPGPHRFVRTEPDGLCGLCGRDGAALVVEDAKGAELRIGVECVKGTDCMTTHGLLKQLSQAMRLLEDRRGVQWGIML